MSLRAKRTDREGIFSGNKAQRAIIDIGSNTVRMVVYGGSPRAPNVLYNEKVVARLGRDLAKTNKLPREAIDLAMRGLRRFRLLLEELQVDDVETVATAASREAKNGAKFIKQVAELGLEPRVISGEEEARYAAHGVIGAFPKAAGIVADLGGGSLELVEVANNEIDHPVSLPLGTLRLPEYRKGKKADTRKALERVLKKGGWGEGIGAPLYLVGGTWRAMAVYAMESRKYPLTDPHAFVLEPKAAAKLARRLSASRPDDLREIERISSQRSETMPDAAILLQALLKKLEPTQIVFSSWGLREGLLYDRLSDTQQAQDPLLAGISLFATQRGAPPQLATRIAGWTVDAVPAGANGEERLRLAATTLALASMQVEPNMRLDHALNWALHKRWLAIDARGRAMIAAALAANGNHCDLPEELYALADEKSLEEAVCWGLATRLARRIGARSRRSLHVSRIAIEDGKLVLSLMASHADLFGVPNEKDMALLSGRLGMDYDLRIVAEDDWHGDGEDQVDLLGMGT